MDFGWDNYLSVNIGCRWLFWRFSKLRWHGTNSVGMLVKMWPWWEQFLLCISCHMTLFMRAKCLQSSWAVALQVLHESRPPTSWISIDKKNIFPKLKEYCYFWHIWYFCDHMANLQKIRPTKTKWEARRVAPSDSWGAEENNVCLLIWQQCSVCLCATVCETNSLSV